MRLAIVIPKENIAKPIMISMATNYLPSF